MLIVIDTLEKFRPVPKHGMPAYTTDYAAIAALHKLAHERGIAIVVIHHVRKMEAEALIREAALVLVVFNESAEVLEKDLDLFETVLAQKEVLAGFRQVRSAAVLERIGHRLCTVALWPTIQR